MKKTNNIGYTGAFILCIIPLGIFFITKKLLKNEVRGKWIYYIFAVGFEALYLLLLWILMFNVFNLAALMGALMLIILKFLFVLDKSIRSITNF